MVTFEGINHGTYGGAQMHAKYDIPMTEECGCRVARNEYMAAYRDSNKEVRDRTRIREAARQRALVRLAHLHPGDYRRLLEEEKPRS
jgi:hypothetical protein